MDMFSPWYFAAILCVAILIVLPKRLFASLDNPVTGGRLETLDGMRGFLALAVFGHHAAITYGFLTAGVWQLPPSGFYRMLGQTGVSFFFMITGYLFWNRLLTSGQSIDWRGLYIGRVFRIGPLFIAAALVAIAISFHRTHWTLNYPVKDVAIQIIQWFSLGLYGQPGVNGYNTGMLMAGVTWTIYYEWLFYFALPALTVAAASRSHLALIVTTLLLIPKMPGVFPDPEKYYISLFLCGMLTASLHKKYPKLSLKSPVYSAVALALLAWLYSSFDTAFDKWAIIGMAAVFIIVASGSSLFGILTTRPALRLGNLSYSIYLLHGLTLTFVFWPNTRLSGWAIESARHYWATILLTTVAVVLASAAAYLLIEKPGMALGKRINNALKSGEWKAPREQSGEVPAS